LAFDFSKSPGRWLRERNLNTTETPLISVVTAFYNAGVYFEQTFNCVMNQTFPWFEWIIIDDGSTDEESVAVLRRLADKDQIRIRIERQENRGQAAARNIAVELSRTDLIVPLDADDLISPTYLEYVYWGLHFNSDATWCYTNSLGFQDQEYCWSQPFSASRMKEENLLVCTAAIRKKDFEQVGGYDDSQRNFDEDWHLWLKLLGQGKFPVHLSEHSFWYRRTGTGAQQQVQRDPVKREESRRIIRRAAEAVDTKVMATAYPNIEAPGEYFVPKISSWDRKVFQSHNKIHVMMLLPWLEMGGADLFNLQIVQKIDKSKFEISIVTTVPAEHTWNQRFEEHVTDLFHLPNFLDVKHYAEFISYFIQTREIDILFLSNSYYGYYLVPWLRKEFPKLAIIDYVHMEEWYWRNGGFARTSGAMGEILEKTYVCNGSTRNVLIESFGRKTESVETLYIGVDHEYFDETKVAQGKARTALGIKADRPIVLFPCRIHPQKRPFLMLEIAKELKKRILNIAIAVVGDGPQLEELKIRSREWELEETIYFAGLQKDMLPYYKDATVTLICSIKEGLALTAYESLSMGTPVVSSDVGGQKELIDESVGAILPLMQIESEELDKREFTAAEIEQYVQAIEGILGNQPRYETMRRSCRQRIEERFSVNVMIERLESEFVELLHNEAILRERQLNATNMQKYPNLVKDFVTLYAEIDMYEHMYKNSHGANVKNELMRIANSKWGRKLVKLAFKFKLNKMFK
jgi:glycosyltransferase involved in cell wall biosynthesis